MISSVVERLVYTEDVGSSTLSSPTIFSLTVLFRRSAIAGHLRGGGARRRRPFGRWTAAPSGGRGLMASGRGGSQGDGFAVWWLDDWSSGRF